MGDKLQSLYSSLGYNSIKSNCIRAEIPQSKRGRGRKEYSKEINVKAGKRKTVVKGVWWK